jgi:hypothetical protein
VFTVSVLFLVGVCALGAARLPAPVKAAIKARIIALLAAPRTETRPFGPGQPAAPPEPGSAPAASPAPVAAVDDVLRVAITGANWDGVRVLVNGSFTNLSDQPLTITPSDVSFSDGQTTYTIGRGPALEIPPGATRAFAIPILAPQTGPLTMRVTVGVIGVVEAVVR